MIRKLLVAGMLVMVLVVATAMADDGDLLPVQPPADIPQNQEELSSSSGLWEFDGTGYIDRIDDAIVTIGDMGFRFAASPQFYDDNRRPLDRSAFHVGTGVGYVLSGTRVIQILIKLTD